MKKAGDHEEYFIAETEHWRIYLAASQAYLGKCAVVSKRHCGDLADLTSEELMDFHQVLKRLQASLCKSFNATLFNWTCLMNHAYQKNPPHPHVHWHFRPRYDHTVEFEGYEFKDSAFGKHYLRGCEEANKPLPGKVRKKLIKIIQENF